VLLPQARESTLSENTYPIRNWLLRRLSASDRERLGSLERVDLALRKTLEAANEPVEFVYFLEDGLASVVSDNAAGTIEVGVIGVEGMTGLGLASGDMQSPFETFMQIEGMAMRCTSVDLVRAMAESEALRALVGKYARAFAIQVATTAIANGRSKLEERLARWLLMVSDRAGAHFHITHEFVAVMLGVRRSGVTLAIQSLEGRGLIRASRGGIHIADRDGMIGMAQHSYGLAEREYQRLLGEV
jgi:CRP-like cAMP-binding protein